MTSPTPLLSCDHDVLRVKYSVAKLPSALFIAGPYTQKLTKRSILGFHDDTVVAHSGGVWGYRRVSQQDLAPRYKWPCVATHQNGRAKGATLLLVLLDRVGELADILCAADFREKWKGRRGCGASHPTLNGIGFGKAGTPPTFGYSSLLVIRSLEEASNPATVKPLHLNGSNRWLTSFGSRGERGHPDLVSYHSDALSLL